MLNEEYIVIHVDPNTRSIETEFSDAHPYEVILTYLSFINRAWLKSAMEDLSIAEEAKEKFVEEIFAIMKNVVFDKDNEQ